MTAARWLPAYIGVGSNLDSPFEQLDRGIAALAGLPQTLVVLQSGRYQSAPFGPVKQPDFINAVVALLTQLPPGELLDKLKDIEARQGRDHNAKRWGPRTLDLDLLAYSQLVLDEDRLIVPHPGIAGRNFVLLPWSEIAPHFHVPGLGSVSQLASQLPGEPAIKRIA